MTRLVLPILSCLALGTFATSIPGQRVDDWDACTSIMVSRGASTDGSVMITYSADAPFLPKLLHHRGGPKPAGKLIDAVGWEDERVRGQVRQVAHTNSVARTNFVALPFVAHTNSLAVSVIGVRR